MTVAPPPTPSADSPLVRGQVEIPLQARGSVLRAKARGRAGGRRALFTSPDPIIPTQYNPQALNLFAYTYNNPLKYTDPSGHFAETHEERWALIRRSTNMGWSIAGTPTVIAPGHGAIS